MDKNKIIEGIDEYYRDKEIDPLQIGGEDPEALIDWLYGEDYITFRTPFIRTTDCDGWFEARTTKTFKLGEFDNYAVGLIFDFDVKLGRYETKEEITELILHLEAEAKKIRDRLVWARSKPIRITFRWRGKTFMLCIY